MRSSKDIVRVGEVMKPEVDLVDGMMTVTDALKGMQYPDTQTLVVDKRDENDEYGVVMFRDIARRCWQRTARRIESTCMRSCPNRLFMSIRRWMFAIAHACLIASDWLARQCSRMERSLV